MSKRIIIPSLVLIGLLCGAIFVQAMSGPDCMNGPDGDENALSQRDGQRGQHLEKRLAMMTEILDLTADQQSEIKQIFEAERDTNMGVRQQLRAEREKLHTLLRAQPLDEAAVRAQAGQLSVKQTDAMIVRAKVHPQVFAILTPEQQAKAEKLKSMMGEGRRGHKRHERGMGF